ncbi:monovalent cation/H(+) antiporter subunit G [Kocuria palustris]|uniref:monovalent cation/H(+) antiporter subunit G n=1 Tax=Kocuria palustris TaxID=71999 RepID=UPI0011A046D8|nr:monovalent cation/H(+) antiporter subunit G [Kocuria palustris]
MSPIDMVLDIAVAILLLVGCLMSLTAGLGLIRLPDILSRMHAATKPQVLGLLCMLLAVVINVREWSLLPLALLGWGLMLLTAPVSAHMVGRSSYRTKHVSDDDLIEDDLAAALEAADSEEAEQETGRSR